MHGVWSELGATWLEGGCMGLGWVVSSELAAEGGDQCLSSALFAFTTFFSSYERAFYKFSQNIAMQRNSVCNILPSTTHFIVYFWLMVVIWKKQKCFLVMIQSQKVFKHSLDILQGMRRIPKKLHSQDNSRNWSAFSPSSKGQLPKMKSSIALVLNSHCAFRTYEGCTQESATSP